MAASRLCCRQKSENYTDVVIIGNGPSAITLSYMLHGYRPYYNGASHSNSILINKLRDSKASIVEQDLEFLSEGLEGRSTNPVALLWDTLSHPDADLGADNPSVLDWKLEKEKVIPHVVLGKTKAGGSWQHMEGSMHTISQNNWMELPGCSFRDWLAKRHRRMDVQGGRATVADVRSYYEEYVEDMGLREHFRDYHVVTSVQKVFDLRNCADSESGEVEHCCQNIQENHCFLWEVRGYCIKLAASAHNVKDMEEQEDVKQYICDNYSDWSSSSEDLTDQSVDAPSGREEFCFVTPHVVLATGTYDVPNRLGIKGENLPSVLHSLCAFEQLLTDGVLTASSSPVCIVGAGLSAADAILMALNSGIPVIHIFRRSPNDPSLIFKKLPSSMYPEYHRVASLMKGETEHELYQAYPRHRLVEVGSQMVFLKPCSSSRFPSPHGADGSIISVDVSCTVIMIGSRPDLSFLASGGRNLGVVPKWQIDSKHNPVDVDLFTYQSVHEPRLFAMGPLIGDNFVRFGIGGALGITNHLTQCSQKGGL